GFAADQRTGGGVGRKAIEIRIAQDRDPLLGFRQQASGDRLEILEAYGLASENAAALVASPNPLRILFHGQKAVGNPAQPFLDRRGEFFADRDQLGISAEQLIGRILMRLAMVLGKQRQLLSYRVTANGRILGQQRMSKAELARYNRQPNRPHVPKIPA